MKKTGKRKVCAQLPCCAEPFRFDRATAKLQRDAMYRTIEFMRGTSSQNTLEALEGVVEFMQCVEDELDRLFGELDVKRPVVAVRIEKYE